MSQDLSLLPDKLPPFADLRYERPDIRAFTDKAKRAKNLFQKWNKARNLRDATLSFQSVVDSFYQQAVLAQIRLAQHEEDPFFSEEWAFFAQVEPSVDRLVQSVNGWLRQKSSSPELKAFLGTNFLHRSQVAHTTVNRSGLPEWEREQEALAKFLACAGEWEEGVLTSWELVQASFLELLECRRALAEKQQFPDYLTYSFSQQNRADFTPQELRALRSAIKQYFSQLAPYLWNGDVEREEGLLSEPQSTSLFQEATQHLQKALSYSPEDYLYGMNSLCNRVTGEMDWFLHLARAGYVDLEVRPRKAAGVECFYLPQTGLPFLFAHPTASPVLLRELIRETGRCYAYLQARATYPDFTPFVELGLSSSEFIGMSFFWLAQPHMDIFYGNQREDFVQWGMRHAILTLLHTCLLDEFQDILYRHALTGEEMISIWNRLKNEYLPDGASDFFGLQDSLSFLTRGDLAVSPFYTVDRLIAQVASLSFWDGARKKPAQALRAWTDFCAAGSREPFLRRLQRMGLPSPLNRDNVKRLAFQTCSFMGY